MEPSDSVRNFADAISGFGAGADVAPQPGATTSHRSRPAEAAGVMVGEVGDWAQPTARNAAQINAYFTSASFNSRGGRVAD